MEALTYRQLLDWMDYYGEEPFGELRADMRHAANTLFLLGVLKDSEEELPSLMHPHFDQLSDEALEQSAAKIDEYVKQKYGKQHRQTSDSPDGGHVRREQRDGSCAGGG